METSDFGSGLASSVLDGMADAVYVVDRDRRILLWNRAAEALTGFRADEVVGRRCRDRILNHCDAEGTELCGSRCPLTATMHDGRPRVAEVFLRHHDGHRQPVVVQATPLRDDAGEIMGATEVFRDNSEMVAIRRQLAEMETQALTDPLTGLGNRRYVDAELRRWWANWRRHGQRFGVLLIDVDHFKAVNDRFGHDAGDRALRMVASTLAYGSRAADVVGRWGGEEFIVLSHATDLAALRGAAERLRALVARCGLDDADGADRIQVTVSAGGGLVGGDDIDGGTLVARADAALYRAKAGGRNQVRLGDPTVIDVAGATVGAVPAAAAAGERR